MERTKFRIIFGVLTISLALLALPARADILNVPDDFETIQTGIDAAEDGDTVLVEPGVYNENIVIARPITVASLVLTTENRAYIDSTIIDGRERGSVVEINRAREDVVLRGFTLRNGWTNGGGGGVYVNESNTLLEDLIIRNNYSNSYGSGIWCCCYENNSLRIQRVVVEENESQGGAGIRVDGHRAIVELEDVIINRNIGGHIGGMAISGGALNMRRVAITNNVAPHFAGIELLGLRSENDMIWENVTIAGNGLIDDGRGGGVVGSISSGHIIMRNCLIYDNAPANVVIRGGTLTVAYSCIVGGRDAVLESRDEEFLDWGEGNIDEDPQFVDPDEGDYHLTEDSPCIDAGDPESPEDPDGSRSDIGAFYFHQRDIDVDPNTLEFVGIQTGTVDSLAVIVRNVGLTTLNLTSVGIASFDAPLDVDEIEEALPIEPDSSYTIWVRFLPFEENQYLANLIIESDDPDEATVEVLISATALSVGDDLQFPTTFGITDVYPNPFNSSTTITYQLPSPVQVSLSIYDLSGRLVEKLIDNTLVGGVYNTVWQPDNLASGLYFVRLKAGDRVQMRKLILIR